MSTFGDELTALCTREYMRVAGNRDASSEMIAELAAATAGAIAILLNGHPKATAESAQHIVDGLPRMVAEKAVGVREFWSERDQRQGGRA